MEYAVIVTNSRNPALGIRIKVTPGDGNGQLDVHLILLLAT